MSREWNNQGRVPAADIMDTCRLHNHLPSAGSEATRAVAGRWGLCVLLALSAWLAVPVPAAGQGLRFSNRRRVEVPDYATMRLGPLYSTLTLSQSLGAQYVRIQGEGVDFLFGNQRGEFKRDGYDFPIITTLALRNYLILTRRMDLEFNIRVQYRYYPMGTQENDLTIDFTDEGIYADLSTEFMLTPTLRGRIYDSASYRTQYIDIRGTEDRYGGERFERFENVVGLDLDWLISRYDNLALSLSRQDTVPMGDSFKGRRTWTYQESLAYEHQFSPFLVGGVRAEASQRFTAAAADPDNYTQGMSVFAEARVTRYTEAGLSMGYSSATTRGGDPYVSSSSAGITMAGHIETRITPWLDHELRGSRRVQSAFLAGVDIIDQLSYRLNWRTFYLPGSFSTAVSRFDPIDGDRRNGYSTWESRLQVSQRVSRLVQMAFLTAYTARWNEETQIQVPIDASADFETWVTRLSMSMPLTRNIDFTAYAEHAERRSDADEMRYTRDIVAALATWSHRF